MAVRRAEGRSAALARAQAQLTGRRLTGREELDGAPRNRLAALEPSKSPGLSAVHMASDLSDLSDLGRRELEGASLAETPTPPQTGPRRRFVKQKPQEVALDTQQARPSPATRTGFAAASRGERSSAVLRKLAQIESKFHSRKARRDVGQAPTTDEEISLSDFSRSPEPRPGGQGGLGKATGLKETAAPIRGSSQGGTEGRRQAPPKELGEQEDLLARKKWIRSPPTPPSSRPRSPLPGKTFLKRPTPRSPSPPGKHPPARLSRGALRSSTPAGSSSPDASSVPPREASLSERSVVRSLDELFLAAGGGPSDDDSSSSSDFRVNVLSLDDLAPAAASQTEVSGEAPAMPMESKEELGASPFAAVSQSPFKAQSPPRREEEEEEEEETEEDDDPGDTEISERLNSTSAGSSHPEEEDEEEEEENPTSAEYSEDFESLAASREQPSSRDPSGAGAPSEHPASSSLTCPPGGARTTCLPVRILMKDAAVQTGRSSLAYCWLQGDAPAALGEAGSLLETPPIASHVVSLETLEALTTYSPAVFALNELLKQNVLLIRQFADAARQLHASWVASLEEQRGFHYHTLEEAKEYIERHKPPPLTVEQAVRELERQGQAAF
ncbi:uncharacterized protein C19orf44 homolog isoform X2 [Podarcis raffonei]|uniref:uncharacterized protein C19orf44 homolog isoform X2 n=1 Tax=Podarcis raffonei TaxID=65483 RepID=UPI0023296597|nr:uncharacterized protein C19orf44 homolog isoform X2 [Podarcis raffonei]